MEGGTETLVSLSSFYKWPCPTHTHAFTFSALLTPNRSDWETWEDRGNIKAHIFRSINGGVSGNSLNFLPWEETLKKMAGPGTCLWSLAAAAAAAAAAALLSRRHSHCPEKCSSMPVKKTGLSLSPDK